MQNIFDHPNNTELLRNNFNLIKNNINIQENTYNIKFDIEKNNNTEYNKNIIYQNPQIIDAYQKQIESDFSKL